MSKDEINELEQLAGRIKELAKEICELSHELNLTPKEEYILKNVMDKSIIQLGAILDAMNIAKKT